MKTITLPKGTLHLNIDDLAHYMALSLWPPRYDDSPGDALEYGFCCATLKAELAQAVESQELPVRDPLTFGPHAHPYGANVQHALVRVDDLRKYVADRDLLVEVEESENHASDETSEPGETEAPEIDAPTPLTTGDIAFAFAGLRWGESEWKKPLGDKPKWLVSCVMIPGQQGVSETRWNPVLIGAALVQQGHASARSVRAKFQTVPLLMPWLDPWKTYEANYCDNE
jgi:hypothetical protein